MWSRESVKEVETRGVAFKVEAPWLVCCLLTWSDYPAHIDALPSSLFSDRMLDDILSLHSNVLCSALTDIDSVGARQESYVGGVWPNFNTTSRSPLSQL